MSNLDIDQLTILKDALTEYEEAHWATEDDKWQDSVNNLRDLVRNELNNKKGN